MQKAMENQPRKVLSKEKQSGKAHIACSDNTDPYKEYAAAMPEPQGSHSQGLHFDVRLIMHSGCWPAQACPDLQAWCPLNHCHVQAVD